jgi:enterochelin esterase-like enzyme
MKSQACLPRIRRSRRLWLGAAAALALGARAQASAQSPNLPQVSVGRIERLPGLRFEHIDARPVDVWLPPGYEPGRRHAVLYLHDGQNVFDDALAFGGVSWGMPATAGALQATGALRPFIVVAIWNGGPSRSAEFYPPEFAPHLPAHALPWLMEQTRGAAPAADAYLGFIVDELKPAVDARFATLADASNTFMMGSSRGGVVSVYALLEYPQVFGAAAALSTHWITRWVHNDEFGDAAMAYMAQKLPMDGGLKLWMDHGTTQLDAQYAPTQRRIDAFLRLRGFGPPMVQSHVFDGTGHHERDWAARLAQPLAFLLGRQA